MANEQIQTGLIEGIAIDNNTYYHIASTAYGECSTASINASKIVQIDGFKLIKGITIHVKFINDNTASTPTLNVNNTGAINIVLYNNVAAGITSETDGWQAGAVLSLTYDGQYWVRDSGYNTNTTYATLTQTEVNTGTNTTGKLVTAKIIKDTVDNINITTEQISDFPSSFTPESHTHGNILNDGTLLVTDVTIASGDKLVITDDSNSNKIARASIEFDGSTVTQALTKKGTWATFNNYSHPTTSGNKHIPSGGSSGQILGWDNDGVAKWITPSAQMHRPINMNGTLILGNNTTALDLTAGSYILLTNSNGVVTITNTMTAADLGLSSAMHYRGETSTNISTGSNATVTINNNELTAIDGDVVLYNTAEYVWANNQWNLLGDEGSYKVKLTAVNTATDEDTTATRFVYSVTLNINGVITVKTRPMPLYTLPLAADGTRGGVQIGYVLNGRNYPIELNNEKMYVNVPWTDTHLRLHKKTVTNSKKLPLIAAIDGSNLNAPAFSNEATYEDVHGAIISANTPTIDLFDGTITAEYFSGSGANLTNLDADLITDGTLLIAHGGTGINTINPHYALLGPNSGINNAAPTWRSITIDDLPVTNNNIATALTDTDLNIPTVRTVYYGLPTINNAHNYTSATTLFAPTSSGTEGWPLISAGTNNTPVWYENLKLQSTTSNNITTHLINLANGIIIEYDSTNHGRIYPYQTGTGSIGTDGINERRWKAGYFSDEIILYKSSNNNVNEISLALGTNSGEISITTQCPTITLATTVTNNKTWLILNDENTFIIKRNDASNSHILSNNNGIWNLYDNVIIHNNLETKGYIYHNTNSNNTAPLLWMNSTGDYDVLLISSSSSSSPNYTDGYLLLYYGDSSNTTTYGLLLLIADNSNGLDIAAITVTQTGAVSLGSTLTAAGDITVTRLSDANNNDPGPGIWAENQTTSCKVGLYSIDTDGNHGVYSTGYFDGTNYNIDGRWLIFRSEDNRTYTSLLTSDVLYLGSTITDLTDTANGTTNSETIYHPIWGQDVNKYSWFCVEGYASPDGSVSAFLGVRNCATDGTPLSWKGLTITLQKGSDATSFSIGGQFIAELIPSSWINGLRYNNAAYNIADYDNAGSYNPWMRATNTWSSGEEDAKVGRWFSFGTCGSSFYWLGSTTTRTENGVDLSMDFDISSGDLTVSHSIKSSTGSITAPAGSIWAGTNNNTTAERQVGVLSGAGLMYMYSAASDTGNRGIYLPAHGTGGARSLFVVGTNNEISFADGYNGTQTKLAYSQSGLAASAITWLTCWNGYELRAISKAEMANAVDSAHKWVRIGGDTMTGLLKITTNSNTVTIGSQNTGFCHIYNSADIPFIFNKLVQSTSSFKIYNNGTLMGAGYVELSGGTPYIDFHYGSSSADYTSRLIENASGQLYISGKLKVATSRNGYALNAASFICDSWVRTVGSTGWYNESYGGGWYMEDSTWIRSYGSKSVYINTGDLRCDGSTWGGKCRLTGDWLGFYSGNGGGTRYGFLEVTSTKYYFRKENGADSYPFDFNGNIMFNGTLQATAGNINLHNTSGYNLAVLNDGNLVLYNSNGTSRWSSKTATSSYLVKLNIMPLDKHEIDNLKKLNVIRFNYRPEMKEGDTSRRYGLIAEEVLPLFPDIVDVPENYDASKFDITKGPNQPILGIKYERFIPILIKAVQVQDKEIQQLKSEIQYLKNRR